MPLFGPPNIFKLRDKQDFKGLLKALKHKDGSVREQAALALVYLILRYHMLTNSDVVLAIKRLDEFQTMQKIYTDLSRKVCSRCGRDLDVHFSTYVSPMDTGGQTLHDGYICLTCGRLECNSCMHAKYDDWQSRGMYGGKGWSCSGCGGEARSLSKVNWRDKEELPKRLEQEMARCFF